MALEYRTALITGASSGLGAGLARKFAGQGVEVALVARRKPELEALAREIRSAGGRVHIHCADVGDPVATEELVRKIDGELGGLDLVIANAGVGKNKWSGNLSWEDSAQMIHVNVIGAVATLTAVLPKMVERNRGHLVGVSSLAQYRGLPLSAVYSASKAFLSTFLEGVRIDLRETAVTVTDIRPGFVKTAFTAKAKHPMPFLLEEPAAVDAMFEGIVRKAPIVAFPWALASLVRFGTVMPVGVYDRVVAQGGKSKKQ